MQVSRRIVAYSGVMAGWTLLLVAGPSWVCTAVVAVLAGPGFVLQAPRLARLVVAGPEVSPMRCPPVQRLLCVLFASIAVDAALGLPVLGVPG